MSAYKFADLKKKKLAKYMSDYKSADLKKKKKNKVAMYADLKKKVATYADLKKKEATWMSAYIAADQEAKAKYMVAYMRNYRKQDPVSVKRSYIKKKKN